MLQRIFQKYREKKRIVMLSKFEINKHQQYLTHLPKISQSVDDIKFFYSPVNFREALLEKIAKATYRICIIALYLEQDEGGHTILNALYEAKRQRPELTIYVLVDWHRARRGRIGSAISNTNADWYYNTAQINPDIDMPVFGVTINTNEALGVLHCKGFIIDDFIFYSGASINNVYLHKFDKYRYDRYHLIRNIKMADTMFNWIDQHLIHSFGVYRLDKSQYPKNQKIKNNFRLFKHNLRGVTYHFQSDANNEQLSVTPLIGLGKSNQLNKTIFHLMSSTSEKLIICTPYFNLPTILVKTIVKLLRSGKKIEIIIGDKTASDFFIPEDQPFKIISVIPFLYEINLRQFLSRLQCYINNNQLIVRLWKDKNNSYHVKGIWVDNNWILLTGNNLNPRAWYLDLENAILLHDPCHELVSYSKKELDLIRTHTTVINHHLDIQNITEYPVKVRKLISRLHHTHIDRLIRKIL